MIDWQNEQVIPIQEVRKYVPSRTPGKRVSPSTVWRWAIQKNNPLETFTVGGGRFTSVEAIGRFIARSNVPDDKPAIGRTHADAGADRRPACAGPSANAVSAGERLRQLIRPN